MEYVDELIKKTKQRFDNFEEPYLLEKEILIFLNDDNVSENEKNKLRNEGLLEYIAMLSDGYKKQNKLERYSTK